MSLDKELLYQSCYNLAKEIVYEHKPVDVVEIKSIAQRLFCTAIGFEEQICEIEVDPNIITRAVTYLSYTHALPSMVEDIKWFQNSLSILIELACPNTIQTKKTALFLKDVTHGVLKSLFDVIDEGGALHD